jgi:hypothetical protein
MVKSKYSFGGKFGTKRCRFRKHWWPQNDAREPTLVVSFYSLLFLFFAVPKWEWRQWVCPIHWKFISRAPMLAQRVLIVLFVSFHVHYEPNPKKVTSSIVTLNHAYSVLCPCGRRDLSNGLTWHANAIFKRSSTTRVVPVHGVEPTIWIG